MKIAILGSGRGSNAEAILQAWRDGRLGRARPVLILSDREEAGILRLGERYGVPSRFLHAGHFRTKLEGQGEAGYISAIRESRAELVVLAGFMRVIKPGFLEAFAGRMINLHPSLLPSFKGLHGIRQAWEYGVKVTGCTVHFVTGAVDGGPIIDQKAVRIEETDTLETLEAKIHGAEHALLPDVIARLSEGKISLP